MQERMCVLAWWSDSTARKALRINLKCWCWAGRWGSPHIIKPPTQVQNKPTLFVSLFVCASPSAQVAHSLCRIATYQLRGVILTINWKGQTYDIRCDCFQLINESFWWLSKAWRGSVVVSTVVSHQGGPGFESTHQLSLFCVEFLYSPQFPSAAQRHAC